MEWVEIRGESLEEAKERALDQLGVALEDAEFEIVAVPESRWLGLKKTEARVRARVRPTQPRAKRDTRQRRGRKGDDGGSDKGGRNKSDRQNQKAKGTKGDRDQAGDGRSQTKGASKKSPSNDRANSSGGTSAGGSTDKPAGKGRSASAAATASSAAGEGSEATQKKSADRSGGNGGSRQKKEKAVSDHAQGELVPIEEQTEMVQSFLGGVLTGFDLEGEVQTTVDDDGVHVDVSGANLGLLIGPKGGTIRALQEVTRAAAQRHADGRETHRINVDVAGYRERRRAALGEFAQRQAAVVRDENRRVALEPMGSADRKAVHDAVMEIEGVRSISEGDDPRRRIVLIPDN